MTVSVMDVIRDQLSEKITVYLSKDTLDSLHKDCKDFEVKNISEFTNLLVRNYVSDYFEMVYSSVPEITRILSDSYEENTDTVRVAKEISFVRTVSAKSNGALKHKLNFRLNKKTINKAVEALYNGPSSLDISAFFRSMFLSYLSLPVYKREQVIYKEELLQINTIIRNKEKMSYYRKDTGKSHTFNPYSIEASSHEMFNYLVGQFEHGQKHKSSIRISKIANIVPIHEKAAFTPDFEECLEAMKRNGIQFAMDEVVTRKVELTNDQYRAFNRKYFDRPEIVKEENYDGLHICYFDCSKFQLETYFSPFENRIEIK